MRLLVDSQLPPVRAEWLRRQGHDAEHVSEADLMLASDAVIWTYAADRGAVIVTKDADFEASPPPTAAVRASLWLRVGNVRNRGLISRLAVKWPRIEQAFADDARVVEFW